MKFILISDAVKLTGLDRQTIRNWIAKGIIPSQKINGTFYVDQDTFEALAEPMRDVDNARKSLEALKEEYQIEKDKFRNMQEYVRDEHNVLRFLSICVNSGIRTHFFETLTQVMNTMGILSDKEAGVLSDLLNGMDYNVVADKYNCSRERIRQIAEKAVRMSRKIFPGNNSQEKDKEIESLKIEIEVLKKMVYRQAVEVTEEGLTDEEKRLVRMDALELHALLSRRLFDEDISVRALNALLNYKKDGILVRIKTLGELCQVSKYSLLQQKNIGKKTVDELTAYLETNGLTWDMNIDRIKELKL